VCQLLPAFANNRSELEVHRLHTAVHPAVRFVRARSVKLVLMDDFLDLWIVHWLLLSCSKAKLEKSPTFSFFAGFAGKATDCMVRKSVDYAVCAVDSSLDAPTERGIGLMRSSGPTALVDAHGQAAGICCQGVDVTDSLRPARAIAETEARFRMMTENVPIIIWVTDAAGDCTYLNPRWYELTGQTPEQARGLGWTDATHPHDRDRVATTFLKANAAQAPFRIEYRLRLAGGSYRWVLDAAGPRFDAAGTYLGYVGSVIDINDRHEAELRIQVSEGRFRAAVGAVEGYLWTNNAVGVDRPGAV
jgi:PAS domain S-box-containing protein